MKKIYCIFSALVLFSFATSAQNQDSVTIKKLADDILTNGKLYDNLRYLCKKIGPRLSGSANAQKAVLATAKMLKEAGADTVYLQPCMVPHWIRGKKETGYIQLDDQSKYNLQLCAIGNTVGTAVGGLRAPVIEVKNMAELQKLGVDAIKGKIVFFNIVMDPTYINTFQAYGDFGAGRFTGPAQAAKYGAVGAMVRSLSINVNDYPHTGVTRYDDAYPKIPAVCISTKDANWLSEQIQSKKVVSAYFKTNCKMLPDAPSYNVIGEIRGTEFPDEIITVGGHLDSWDLAEGANDDGSGVTQSIEIIRALKATGIKPLRTIRAVMFMNEENGGKGADAYLENALQKKEHHIFALESDAGGFSPRGFTFEMTPDKEKKLMQWLPLFYNYGVYFFSKGGSGSDVGPLRKTGAVLAGLSPDSQRYFDIHHAATDVFENVSERELKLGAVNMAALVWLVSEHGL
ncbi:MAG: M20/M25/M40 family metallo-hydrolase [Bacteroidetes bacterium]|nr:M20/M25/M40 family metallo-hydrolase [Bacteroidota bacterium]MBS1757020.1 M20/M25/M40 family metallo-hydrolase [Bacteroidota bacterium]